MWHIMIADDTAMGRDQAQAALVRVQGNGDYRKERMEKVRDLFDIRRFHIAGAAIKALEAGWKPDLAIIDIDFQELDAFDVAEHGFDAETEINNLRGFDILTALVQHSPQTTTILFTGKADQDDMIAEALRDKDLRQGRGYFIKTSKSIGINELSMHISDCLGQLAANHGERATPAQRREIRNLLSLPEEILLKKDLNLGARTLRTENLLAYAAKYDRTCDAILYPPAREKLTQLLSLARVEHFEPNGWWQLDFIHRTILDWRDHPDYEKINEEINTDAVQYVVETIRDGGPVDIVPRTNLDTYIKRNTDRFAPNSAFGSTFINALKLRRALIGLSHLSQEPIWGPGRNGRMDLVLDKFMQQNHLNATPDNMRNFFSQVRGLSIATLNLPQRLNTQRPHILEEEAQWLQRYPDEVIRILKS